MDPFHRRQTGPFGIKRRKKKRRSADLDCCLVDALDPGCFVATASYGRFHRDVRTLRRYRDRRLRRTPQGRLFIKAYYRYGRYGARMIYDKPRAKAAVRFALRPAVRHARRKLDE